MKKGSNASGTRLHRYQLNGRHCATCAALLIVLAVVLLTAILLEVTDCSCSTAGVVAQLPAAGQVVPSSHGSVTAANWLSRWQPAAPATAEVTADDAADDRTGRHYLAFCLASRDQSEDLREWVGHHLAIGASTIYLYDHLSEPPLNATVADYIANGSVVYSHWDLPHEHYAAEKKRNPKAAETAQIAIYRHCLTHHGHKHQFMGLLDSDEFLIITDGSPSVPHQLRRMMAWETISGLAVHWRIFGSGGHEKRPAEGMLKGFTKCGNTSNIYSNSVKTLANTDFAIGPAGHLVEPKSADAPPIVTERFRCVTTNHPGAPTWDHLVINHYFTRSREEYAEKQRRKSGAGRVRSWAEFDAVNELSVHDCTDAAERYGPYP